MGQGRTIAEKILAAKSGTEARAGDTVICTVDAALGTDASGPMAIDYFRQMGGDAVKDPARLVFALDHYAPPPTQKAAGHLKTVREFCAAQNIAVHEIGEGIGHQLILETGRARPGALVVGADSHAVTYGALNCFGTGIGSSDLAGAMLTSKVWLRIPETIHVNLEGCLSPGVSAKDAALALIGELGADGAAYKALEFSDVGAAELSMDDRFVLANMSMECGAKAGLLDADAKTDAYLSGRTIEAYAPVSADIDAVYAETINLDLSNLAPQLAEPHHVDNVVGIEAGLGQVVDMVYLGTCTGGRASDFHDALRVLEAAGGTAPGVNLVITPASREVHMALLADGTLAGFAEMGAIIQTPGCGSCCGTCGSVVADGMTVISTANRNFKGRMGNPNAEIWLASPASCAMAAARGVIADPREVLS